MVEVSLCGMRTILEEGAELERLNAEQSELLRIAEGVNAHQERRIAELESALLLKEAACRSLAMEIDRLKRPQSFAARAEADLVSATFPANALKHSR